MKSDSSSTVRFGVFELDVASGELRKSGVKVRLQEQPFQVLKALLEKPSEVVTREELQQQLWPDETFVDFEDGLSTAVRKVRTALGESASNPRFVETLPKRGYRFIGPVSLPEPLAEERLARDPATQPRKWRTVAVGMAAAVATTLAILFSLGSWVGSDDPGQVTKSVLAPGEDVHDPVISPDGRYVAFARHEGEGGLWVQALSDERPHRIPDTDGARLPFWSPDSRQIGFGADGLLKRVEVAGQSAPVEIGPTPRGRFSGAAWSQPDDRIYFTGSSVAPSGGEPERFLDPGSPNQFDVKRASHPVALPVRDRRLQLVHSLDGSVDRVREGTHLRDFDKEVQRWLFSGRAATYSSTGHIIYQDDAATPKLYAVAFSLETLQVTGEPFVIAQDATTPSVADDGTLVYLSGASSSMRIMRRDRRGQLLGEPSVPLRDPLFLDLSPSGEEVAFTAIVNEDREVWILDLSGPSAEPRRLTFNDNLENMMLWSPDGRRILYRDTREGSKGFIVHPANGGPPQRLDADGIPADWWGDGRAEYITFHADSGLEYGRADADGEFAFQSFVTDGDYSQITHDGKLIVYGTAFPRNSWFEVRTFPEGHGPWQLSLPGEQIDWIQASRLKNEIFYSADGDLIAVEYVTDPTFRATKRTRLFRLGGREFDVAPDGESFVVMEPFGEDKPLLRVTQNWYAEFHDREQD